MRNKQFRSVWRKSLARVDQAVLVKVREAYRSVHVSLLPSEILALATYSGDRGIKLSRASIDRAKYLLGKAPTVRTLVEVNRDA